MNSYGYRGETSGGFIPSPNTGSPRDAFSSSLRGQSLARAYPPLSLIRQHHRDILYSRVLPPPLFNASPGLASVTAHNSRPAESPYACAQSFNGSPLWCTLDTGASGTQISPSYLKLAYPGIRIIPDTTQFVGVGGGSSTATGRIDLKMIWTAVDGRQVLTNGEAWVAEEGKLEDTGCHVLLGLPYLRDNGMGLRWSSVKRTRGLEEPESLGDRLEIRGVAVEVFIAF